MKDAFIIQYFARNIFNVLLGFYNFYREALVHSLLQLLKLALIYKSPIPRTTYFLGGYGNNFLKKMHLFICLRVRQRLPKGLFNIITNHPPIPFSNQEMDKTY